MPQRRFPYPFIYWLNFLFLVPSLMIFAYHWLTLAMNPTIPSTSSPVAGAVQLTTGLVVSPFTIAVGLFCMRRAPGNVVGVILALWGCSTLSILLPPERTISLIVGYEAMVAGVIWPAVFFLFSYFPDGKVYPPRLTPWLNGLVLLTYLAGILYGLSSRTVGTANDVPNPVFLPAFEPMMPIFMFINATGALGALTFGVVSLSLRFGRSSYHIRQQIKWLMWGFIPFSLVSLVQLGIISQIPSLEVISDILGSLVTLWLMIFPGVAIGFAILRHRLYDIDIVIRKTLVYSVLTVVLAAIYLGAILVAQQVFRAAAGEVPDIAIVLSTLLIAALFSPLRRRIQDLIDRRFYRRKYDAEQMLTRFNQSLRDEVDIEMLKGQFVGVVQETIQPAKIALWVRE